MDQRQGLVRDHLQHDGQVYNPCRKHTTSTSAKEEEKRVRVREEMDPSNPSLQIVKDALMEKCVFSFSQEMKLECNVVGFRTSILVVPVVQN